MAIESISNLPNIEDKYIIKTPTHGSKISRCMILEGPIKTCEPILIDGRVVGTIESDDTVIVSRGAFITGKILAKAVRVDGNVSGPIEAKLVEVTKLGNHNGVIKADKIVIFGKTNGDIIAKEHLIIEESADVASVKIDTHNIVVKGKVSGNILAKSAVFVDENGIVNGDISTDDLSSKEGSRIYGSIYKGSLNE